MTSSTLEEALPSGLPAHWATLVGPEGLSLLAELGRHLDANPGQKAMLSPQPDRILRAFDTPPQSVRAIIIGQDPYPGAGHATGLAFSVDKSVTPLPPSLRNIRAEYKNDLGVKVPEHGDLSAWARNGVLLINRHLTTVVGTPGAHRTLGWATFTQLVIAKLVETEQFLVAILWGREAAELGPVMGRNPRIESAHPSPLSARLGFFGSRPFSRTNQYCESYGVTPIDWSWEGVA